MPTVKPTNLFAGQALSPSRGKQLERTNFPAEVAEMALAHTVSDRTIAAYNRSDLFERRRPLMAAWATFCTTPKEESANIALTRAAVRARS
jgi:hypothetical protein